MEWAEEFGILGRLKEVCQNDELIKRMTHQIGQTAKNRRTWKNGNPGENPY